MQQNINTTAPRTAQADQSTTALVMPTTLTALVDRAAASLASARSAAEILEARDLASFAYDAAKKAARFGKAKLAHDDLIAAAFRVQADAQIDAGAKRRLADEYDAAQERGEARTRGGDRTSKLSDEKFGPSDIGMTDTQIHEARKIRDAEKADPGIIHRTLTEAIESGEEPTRAKVKKAIAKGSFKASLSDRGDRRWLPSAQEVSRYRLAAAKSWIAAFEPTKPTPKIPIEAICPVAHCTTVMRALVIEFMRVVEYGGHAELFAALRDELDDLESLSKRNHSIAGQTVTVSS